ncbi:sensor histidine kinase [Streptomyces sp. NPDC001212]
MSVPPWRWPARVRIGLAAVVSAAAGLLWADTGGGDFWPRWVWFGLATVLAADQLLRWVLRVPPGRRRWLALDGALCALIATDDVAIWALSGGGLFWPIFTFLALPMVWGTHAFLVSRHPDDRERALVARVDTLTRTRRGAVESQAAELKRVERDLHDGAQARLVSLGVTLGMAQDLIHRDPDAAAEMLGEARSTAGSALEDLRTVMHSIQPPVLADRGLADAVRALALDLPLPVTITGDPPPDIPVAVQTAGFFAIAECLANTVKHGQATAASVTYVTDPQVLRVEVGDNGVGGAVVAPGRGLHGIVQRLAILDGQLDVDSPAGGPTRVTITVLV